MAEAHRWRRFCAGSETLIEALERERLVSPPGTFPCEALERLQRLGALIAPLPADAGGLGWGTEPAGMRPLGMALRCIGYGSLPVGRIYEAHVNAVALIARYGGGAVKRAAWTAVHEGCLFALWVAPSPTPVSMKETGAKIRVIGTKGFCTAAGFAARAVITALDSRGHARMLLVDPARARVDDASVELHGMRQTATRAVSFDMLVSESDLIGDVDDYEREPEFSTGAWRTSAVTAGGLSALVDEAVAQLRARGRHTDPHQSARIGRMLIAVRTATMWAEAAAERAAAPGPDLIAFVGLARIAIEQACLDVIPLVQRGLGLAAFVASNRVEAMMRDLATYLRQPAGDEVLSEAAIWFAEGMAGE